MSHAPYEYPVDAVDRFGTPFGPQPGMTNLMIITFETWFAGPSWVPIGGLAGYGISRDPIIKVPANGEFVLERFGVSAGWDSGFPLGWLSWGQNGFGLIERRGRPSSYVNFPMNGIAQRYNYGTPRVPTLCAETIFQEDVFITTDNTVLFGVFANFLGGAVSRVQGTMRLRSDFADEREHYDSNRWTLPGSRSLGNH